MLLVGEPGTGREAFARFIRAEPARARPFVTLIAGTLSDEGAERQLLGTDRQVAPGVLERAGGGTLFIKELAICPAGAALACSARSRAAVSRAGRRPTPVTFKARMLSSARTRASSAARRCAATCSRT